MWGFNKVSSDKMDRARATLKFEAKTSDPHKLKLHEWCSVGLILYVRVPGGWLVGLEGAKGFEFAAFAFVPYDDEFKATK